MTVVTIGELGKIGIIYDRPSHTLPLEAFSGGQNVRFREGGVERVEGHSQIYGEPLVAPSWLHQYPTNDNPHWVYSNGPKMYVVNQATHANITRQDEEGNDVDYTVSLGDRWSASFLNGVGVLNNPNDIPQMWTSINTNTRLQNLTGWPENARCRTMRSFKVFLIAFAPTLADGRFLPSGLWWSSPAEARNVPTSWDYTDPSTLSGIKELSETGDAIIDAKELGDFLMVYKENSIYALQFTPTNAVFNDYKVFEHSGLLSQDCVVNTPRGHVVLMQDDVIIHRGQKGTEQSLLSERFRRWLFNSLDTTYYRNSYLVSAPMQQEVWVCFPTMGHEFPNVALIWNWDTGAIGVRDLPGFGFGTTGTYSDIPVDTSWAGDDGPWEQDSTAWGDSGLQRTMRYPIFADPAGRIVVGDKGNSFFGQRIPSYVERIGLPVAGADYRGNPIVDASKIKFVSKIFPNFEAERGTRVNIQIGAQDTLSDPVNWTIPQTFTVGEDYFVDGPISGRYLAVRFEGMDDRRWKLNSYGLDLTIIGG